MSLGRQLRELRTSAGIKQIELAQLINCGRSTISDVERESRPTTTDVVERWVAACRGRMEIIAEGADPLFPLIQQLRDLDEELRGQAGAVLRALAHLTQMEPSQRRMALRQLRGWIEMVEAERG